MKRRQFITLLGVAVAWPVAAEAQQVQSPPDGRVIVIGEGSDANSKLMGAMTSALLESGDRQKAAVIEELPELADDIAQIEIDPPDETMRDQATLDVGGRRVELRHLGRGHTDSDIVVALPDSGVLFAGDLLENGAPPYFGDAFPLDWPDAVERMLALVDGRTRVVPGHGDPAGRTFVEDSLASFREVADLARRAHADGLGVDDVLPEAPWDGDPLIRQALDRGLAQLRGDLDR
jgi:glyoxylase-like metal-dependent hydrolase (beta-lactamase superfamily II)